MVFLMLILVVHDHRLVCDGLNHNSVHQNLHFYRPISPKTETKLKTALYL